MGKYLNQAHRNEEFHRGICENYPDTFFDWKITALFYIAIHYLKELADKKRIDIGQTHFDIDKNTNLLRNNAFMRISKGA